MDSKAEGVEDRFVTNKLDILLTALYVHLDDRVLPALGSSRDHRPGRKPALADAENACLAVAQQLLASPASGGESATRMRSWAGQAQRHD